MLKEAERPGEQVTIDQLVQYINASTHHRYVYHFTDEANITSIGKHGLLSKNRMRAGGWWPAATGGNDLSHSLDDHRGISDYVSLCFTRNHPMKFLANRDGRLPNPRYLGISTEVLRLPGVRVAFGVANKNDVQIRDLADAIEYMDLEVLYTQTDWRNPEINSRLREAEKMELLIPNHVPVGLIPKVF